MAKIICAFPGTSSGALAILLKFRNGNSRVLRDMSGNVETLERMVKENDILIVRACPAVVEWLNSRGLEFDLVYPDPVVAPTRYTTILALEGWRLAQIHDMLHSWRADLQKLQGYIDTNIHHIVLNEGQSIVDTHGINKDEQCN